MTTPVALLHAEQREDAGEGRHFVAQGRVADRPLRSGDGGIVQDRRLLAPSLRHMAVDGVVAGVQRRVGKPASIGTGLRVEGAGGGGLPVERIGGLEPETFGIGEGGGMDRAVRVRCFSRFGRCRGSVHGGSSLDGRSKDAGLIGDCSSSRAQGDTADITTNESRRAVERGGVVLEITK